MRKVTIFWSCDESEFELPRKRHYTRDIIERKRKRKAKNVLSWTDNINSWTRFGLVDVLRTAED